jgi:hypothetical protein
MDGWIARLAHLPRFLSVFASNTLPLHAVFAYVRVWIDGGNGEERRRISTSNTYMDGADSP